MTVTTTLEMCCVKFSLRCFLLRHNLAIYVIHETQEPVALICNLSNLIESDWMNRGRHFSALTLQWARLPSPGSSKNVKYTTSFGPHTMTKPVSHGFEIAKIARQRSYIMCDFYRMQFH